MHEREAVLDVHERTRAQPIEQLGAIGRREHFVQGVALLRALHALGHAEQVEVVVADHRDRRIAQRAHEAQAGEGVGAAVDEVAHEPQAVVRAVEGDGVEQALERLEAALQVAYRVGRHDEKGDRSEK